MCGIKSSFLFKVYKALVTLLLQVCALCHFCMCQAYSFPKTFLIVCSPPCYSFKCFNIFLNVTSPGKPSLYPFAACMLSCFSHVWLFATVWTIALQTPLSRGFSRQEYWSGLPCPPPGAFPDPGIEPASRLRISCIGRYVLVSPGKPPLIPYMTYFSL